MNILGAKLPGKPGPCAAGSGAGDAVPGARSCLQPPRPALRFPSVCGVRRGFRRADSTAHDARGNRLSQRGAARRSSFVPLPCGSPPSRTKAQPSSGSDSALVGDVARLGVPHLHTHHPLVIVARGIYYSAINVNFAIIGTLSMDANWFQQALDRAGASQADLARHLRLAPRRCRACSKASAR